MKFYIIGKIGEDKLSSATIKKFKKAEEMLTALGYDVFNPTTSGLGAHAESLAKANGTTFFKEIMLLDLQELAKCDAALVLKDWYLSPGSKVELMWARALGKDTYMMAPIGRLIEEKFNVRRSVDHTSLVDTKTVGEVMEVLHSIHPETPVTMCADLILGRPFEQNFEKEIKANVYDLHTIGDASSYTGLKVVFDANIYCSLAFD